jgi:hypothetical protein
MTRVSIGKQMTSNVGSRANLSFREGVIKRFRKLLCSEALVDKQGVLERRWRARRWSENENEEMVKV